MLYSLRSITSVKEKMCKIVWQCLIEDAIKTHVVFNYMRFGDSDGFADVQNQLESGKEVH